ncbi:hypothetical protein E4Z66_09455 [Aliishimia ponticola]|uniref:Lipoprotein n=1 Tax=Aliishimia ponticola TaxID=2499833 RepID=A0A4S4NCI5_9RHOB|nr:hypothetical protein [Aliishimia ponticola]THH37146.1 hypothetical protein E4Z66_09455 [Aliishimia ponticola]
MKAILKSRLILPCAALAALGACVEGTGTYSGPNSVIATNTDKGKDEGPFQDSHPAVVYTPDGCQVWYIDDGVEAYADNRYDPVSGKPICNDAYPPGTVVGPYQSSNSGVTDRIPGPSGVPTVIPTE